MFYTLILLYIERPEILCAIVEYYNFHKLLHMYYEVILPYDSTSIPWQPQKHIWVTKFLCVFPVSSLVHACDKFSGKYFIKSQRDSCDFSSLYYALLYHKASLPTDFSLDYIIGLLVSFAELFCSFWEQYNPISTSQRSVAATVLADRLALRIVFYLFLYQLLN